MFKKLSSAISRILIFDEAIELWYPVIETGLTAVLATIIDGLYLF